MQAASLQATLR